MPIVGAHALHGITPGVEQPRDLVVIDRDAPPAPTLAAMAADGSTEDVTELPRGERSAAMKAFSGQRAGSL